MLSCTYMTNFLSGMKDTRKVPEIRVTLDDCVEMLKDEGLPHNKKTAQALLNCFERDFAQWITDTIKWFKENDLD